MNRLSLLSIVATAVLCVSCYPTRIVTVAPAASTAHSTVVSYTTTDNRTEVYAPDYDICLHLDLQAVGAAFAQASSVREFENILNSSSYMISNLDLNRDGYIDYLRVIETLDRYTHIFVIQAVLGRNVYQDVATLVVENPSIAGCYVEIIGAPYIYGPKYIVRPIFKTRPNIYPHLCARAYTPWSSPWYWDNFPAYYRRPAPMYLSHYQAYVDTYMHNHMYCQEVHYPSSYHYADYDRMTKNIQRHDYSNQHPEQSFSVRTRSADAAGANSAVARAQNARDVRAAQQKTAARSATSATTSSATRTGTTATSAEPVRSATSATTNSTSRTQAATTTSTPTRTQTTTSTTSRSGNTATTSTSSASRSGNTTSTSSATRSGNTSAASTSSATRSGNTTNASTGSATRSSNASSATRTGSSASSSSSSSATRSSGTQTTSRVSNSGRTSTSTKTSTSSSTGTATRSSSSSTATRSSSSTSSSSSSRSSSSSSSTGSATRSGSSSSSSATRSGSSTATRSR